jgi:hypothetical protein
MPITRVRPGYVIRDVLTGQQLILPDNTTGLRAAPTDLFRTYKALVRIAVADRLTRQRGMSRHSFNGLLYQARRLGLIEPVDEEPSEVPAPPFARAPLLNIDTNFPGQVNSAMGLPIGLYNVVEARRVLYEIGGAGAGTSPAWGNIPRYYTALVDSLRGR